MHLTSYKLRMHAQQLICEGTSALALAERMVPSSVGDSAKFCRHPSLLSALLTVDCLPLGLLHRSQHHACLSFAGAGEGVHDVAAQTCLLFQS